MRRIGLGIMASGSGTNAAALLQACADGRLQARGVLVVSNRADAGVHKVAERFGVPSQTLSRDMFTDGAEFADALIDVFRAADADLICLAGYMKKVPPALIRTYPNAILNIHPALLPAHGGKGMYGHFVHEDVIRCGEKESGATIHFVDPEYDRGPILLQRGGVPVLPEDTAETLGARVLQLEHQLYTEAVAKWIQEYSGSSARTLH